MRYGNEYVDGLSLLSVHIFKDEISWLIVTKFHVKHTRLRKAA